MVDRICAEVGTVLTPGGTLLLVHSGLSDTRATVDALRRAGLAPWVVARAVVPFGPVMTARTAMLRQRGLIGAGQVVEELTVVGARRV